MATTKKLMVTRHSEKAKANTRVTKLRRRLSLTVGSQPKVILHYNRNESKTLSPEPAVAPPASTQFPPQLKPNPTVQAQRQRLALKLSLLIRPTPPEAQPLQRVQQQTQGRTITLRFSERATFLHEIRQLGSEINNLLFDHAAILGMCRDLDPSFDFIAPLDPSTLTKIHTSLASLSRSISTLTTLTSEIPLEFCRMPITRVEAQGYDFAQWEWYRAVYWRCLEEFEGGLFKMEEVKRKALRELGVYKGFPFRILGGERVNALVREVYQGDYVRFPR